MKYIKICSITALYISTFALLSWELLAIHYDFPSDYRDILAGVFGILSLALLAFARPWWRGIGANLLLFIIVVSWWLSIKPSQDRNWASDVKILPYATFTSTPEGGDLVTIHNIRNINYRTETDFDVQYYDKTFNLSKLASADLFISFWGPKYIAHTILSFAFEDGQHLAVSVETRKQQGQEYSAVAGFFRQYELIYIVADERDVVRLRTNYRNEDVYLYKLGTPRTKVRKIFLDYVQRINQLHETPKFYNALLHNCTTNIFVSFQVSPPYPPLSLGILLPGYLDRDFYEKLTKERGLDIPFEQFKAQTYINPAAKAADQDPGFSAAIRKGLPDYWEN